MGVSGAGKTTLMDVLAGRKTGGYILRGQSLFLDILSTSSFLLTLLRSSKEIINQSGKMWKRLSTKLRNLPASSSLLKPNNNSIKINNFQTSSSSTLPPPSSAPLFSVGKKMVEDFMPIATGHEKEELEAQIMGRLSYIRIELLPFASNSTLAMNKA
ncbi:hypothetical protein IFM89_023448 [Coptis chinensis]|uniref:ABC transporter domain-containing protein n=1 Tax=Coptis chinensis TaxID=261450 RepID=A0A835HGZ1_9MAGN|nr:hypothetical protein IFM89_023448 [Coptis chinensis]